MILLGLAGKAGSGKDTVADYLARRYGFLKFSFSDALYREVAAAFGLEDESLLRDRTTKDTPNDFLSLQFCTDKTFVALATPLAASCVPAGGAFGSIDLWPLSPRIILQLWGTEYRRAQDDLYWIKQAEAWIGATWQACQYPEHRPQLFVNTSVRFPNERAWVHKFSNGQVWHLRRDGLPEVNAHVSETPLPVLHDEYLALDGGEKRVYERELYNNDTIARLHYGIELLLSRQVKCVRVEPMLQDTISADPYTETFGTLLRDEVAVQDMSPKVGVGEQGVE